MWNIRSLETWKIFNAKSLSYNGNFSGSLMQKTFLSHRRCPCGQQPRLLLCPWPAAAAALTASWTPARPPLAAVAAAAAAPLKIRRLAREKEMEQPWKLKKIKKALLNPIVFLRIR